MENTQISNNNPQIPENKNIGDYHNILHPDPKKGRTANIILLVIFLFFLLPLNLYAVYSTFGEIYNSISDVNIPTGTPYKEEVEQALKVSAISIGAEMTSTVIIICFLLIYCIGVLLSYLLKGGQKRKGEHVIFLISCFLIFSISFQNTIPLGLLLWGENIFSNSKPGSHIEATFSSQIINVLVTICIIILYMIKPNSILN